MLTVSGDTGKSHKLIIFGIHFVAIGVLTGEFELNMRRIDGAVSGRVLAHGKIDGGG